IKVGNRRKRRPEYLLDVKVQTRGRSLKRLRWFVGIVLVIGLLGLTGYGTCRLVKFGTNGLVYNNPRFAIHQIVVDDDGVLTPEHVVHFAGVQVGENLLSVDLNQVRANLEMLPLVRSVEVRRMMPDRLFIRVEERIAAARLQVPTRDLGDAVFYVD